MKLIDYILLFFSLGCLLITIDLILKGRFQENYYVMMLCLGSFFYYTWRRQKQREEDSNQNKK